MQHSLVNGAPFLIPAAKYHPVHRSNYSFSFFQQQHSIRWNLHGTHLRRTYHHEPHCLANSAMMTAAVAVAAAVMMTLQSRSIDCCFDYAKNCYIGVPKVSWVVYRVTGVQIVPYY